MISITECQEKENLNPSIWLNGNNGGLNQWNQSNYKNTYPFQSLNFRY